MNYSDLAPYAQAVICDYLSVTYPPTEITHLDTVYDWLDLHGFPTAYDDYKGRTIVCLSETNKAYVTLYSLAKVLKVEVKGAAISQLRNLDLWDEFLMRLHHDQITVTRMDAARDYVGIEVYPYIHHFYQSYRQGGYKFGRKSQDLRLINQHRFDGVDTGTVYVGKHSHKTSMCIYDKRAEQYDNHQLDVGVRGRLELRFSKEHKMTLRDAAMPISIFAENVPHEFSHGLDDAPPRQALGVPWQSQPPKPLDSGAILSRISNSPEITRILKLISQLPESDQVGLRKLLYRRIVGLDSDATDLDAA